MTGVTNQLIELQLTEFLIKINLEKALKLNAQDSFFEKVVRLRLSI